MSTVSRLARRFYATVVASPTMTATAIKLPPVFNNNLSSFRTNGETIAKTIYQTMENLRNSRQSLEEKKVLEFMELMEMDISDSDHEVYLNLIAKTKGLEAAEYYFNSLVSCTKKKLSYTALLNCYCVELEEEKAESLFDEMNDLKLIDNTSPFDNLMAMYLGLGKFEKVFPLVVAMKQRSIFPCDVTYPLWIQSCGSLNDLDGVDKILYEMEIDHEDSSSWDAFAKLAGIYSKAGMYSKAETALKYMEKRMKRIKIMNVCKRDCYHFLMSSYAGTSNVTEVYRVWGRLKKSHPEFSNANYHAVLQALSELGDIDGIKKIFAEWKSKSPRFEEIDDMNMKLANVVINSYLKVNMYKEAEAVFDSVTTTKRCKGRPFVKTRELLMVHLLENDQGDLAVKQFEEVVSDTVKNQSKWWSKVLANKEELVWSLNMIRLFFLHFEKAKDVDGAEEFCRNLAKWSPLRLDSETYTILMKVYVASGKLCPFYAEKVGETWDPSR